MRFFGICFFGIKRGENCQKHKKNVFFAVNPSFLRAILSSCSFSKIDQRDSLTVDLFKRSMRAIWSRSIFIKVWREWFDHGWSFKKINKSDLITVDLFKRSKRQNKNKTPCPRSLWLRWHGVSIVVVQADIVSV